MDKLNNIDKWGGRRLLGFLNGKPLIVGYWLTRDNLDIKFNQDILNKEECGKFHSSLQSASFEIVFDRFSGPHNKALSGGKGGKGASIGTSISTLPWIAALTDISMLKSSVGFEGGRVTSLLFEEVAQAIYTSNVLYEDRPEKWVYFNDIARYFDLPFSNTSESRSLEGLIQSLYSQYKSNLKNIGEVKQLNRAKTITKLSDDIGKLNRKVAA